ncbi:hypothetical protein AALB64_06880, partial [Lachnospiraceae bacterium 45-P1]
AGIICIPPAAFCLSSNVPYHITLLCVCQQLSYFPLALFEEPWPVFQGEYYNSKRIPKSQPLFSLFFILFFHHFLTTKSCGSTFFQPQYGRRPYVFRLSGHGLVMSLLQVSVSEFIHIYPFLLSRVNQNSTPFSQFVTPHS